jgi:hypothetical protein
MGRVFAYDAGDVQITSDGEFPVCVGAQLSHAMSSYAIDPESGKLTKLEDYPIRQEPERDRNGRSALRPLSGQRHSRNDGRELRRALRGERAGRLAIG